MSLTIKDRIDQYPLTHVDCVEKAICCMLNEYGESLASIYLLYSNWYGCFDLEQHENSKLSILESLCNKKIIPVDFGTIEISEGMVSNYVERAVNEGAICLIPANLYELYYSKYYHNSDWPHLFCVKKCNAKDKLFYIMDSCHKDKEEQVFSPFVMEYEKLDQVYSCYCNTYPNSIMYHKSNIIYYFHHKKILKYDMDQIDIGRQFLCELDCSFDGLVEKKLLESLLGMQTEKSSEIRGDIQKFLSDGKVAFNHLIKRKQVFYTELLYMIFEEEHQLLEQYLSRLDQIINSWNSFYRYMIARILRKQTSMIQSKLEQVIEEEKKYIHALQNSIEHAYLKKVPKVKWKFVNDVCNEIQMKDNHILIRTLRNHDAWFRDEALKISNKLQDFYDSLNTFCINVKIKEGYQNNNYHVGIFITTKDGRQFIWGSYNEECLRISEIGVKVDLKDFEFLNLLEVELSVSFKKEEIYLVAKNKQGEYGEFCLDQNVSMVDSIGVICKTWENTLNEELCIEVEILDPSDLNVV